MTRFTKQLLLTLLILAGTWGTSIEAETPPLPIKIGATLALTGNLSFIGIEERDGLTLAAEELNSQGGVQGRPIKLIFDDNQGTAHLAISGVQKLYAIDKIDALYSAFAHITQAIAPVAAKQEKILIYASTIGEIARNSPLSFRDHFDATQTGAEIGALMQSKSYHRYGILSETNEACSEFTMSAKETIRNAELAVHDEYLPGEQDFKSSLLRFRAAKIDAILFCTWRDTQVVMMQLKQLGMISTPTYHIVAPFLPVADTPELRSLYEENGLVSSWYGFIEKDASTEQRRFIEAFQNRYGRTPRPDAAFAYDDLKILATALRPCTIPDGIDAACTSRNISEETFSGILGDVTFSEDGLSNREVLLIQVKNGEWVRLRK